MKKVKNLNEIDLIQIPDTRNFIDKTDYKRIYLRENNSWYEETVKFEQNHYTTLVTTSSGKRKKMNLHRIIALVFIPNPNNYRLAILKDGDSKNLSLNNIEWANASKRGKNVYDLEKQIQKKGNDNERSKAVIMYKTFNGQELKRFGSINEAARETGYSAQLISQHCTKEIFPRSKPHYFRFVE